MTVMHELHTELEPVVTALFDRHLANAKEWFPHEYVPWGRGRDFDAAAPWDPDASPVPEPVRVALLVNLLTEDNLPYYYASLSVDQRDSAWAQWTRQWTAEEGRHAIVIRDYLTVTRSIDPVALERGRMQQVKAGEVPSFDSATAGLVYTTLQELATRIAHRNTGELLEDPAGRAVMRRVAADENLHHLFYRDLASEMIVRDPSAMVIAMEQVVRTFAMPGTGITDFARHARTIATLGVYDFSIHYHQIILPIVMQRWDVAELTGLNDEAELARDKLLRFVTRLARAAARTEAKREALAARRAEALPVSG
jgi:acyl-[acyl-carrier-protein] desaturase